MGAEAKTTLRVGRRTFAGTALLESTELIFRGEIKLRVPLANFTSAAVRNGALHVTHADGLAVFLLGESVAAKWADKIRSPRSLADKLGIKPAMRVAILGVKDAGLLSDLENLGAELVIGKVPHGIPMVLWKVVRPSDLTKLAGIANSIARDGAIWVVHPRGDATVADTVIFVAAKAAGLTYTKVVRFSETDTAEKLVIPASAR